jgi:hypothetical protein
MTTSANRTPLFLAKPPKPASEMTDDEVDAWARQVAEKLAQQTASS